MLINEITVGYRRHRIPVQQSPIVNSKIAEEVFRSIWEEDTMDYNESMYMLLLSHANKVIGYKKLSSGGGASTVVDVRHAMGLALKANAVGLMLAHNHPSGSLKISQADKNLTLKFTTACAYLDLKFLDHLILTSEGYTSFLEQNEL